jgi:ferrous iron transport protein B
MNPSSKFSFPPLSTDQTRAAARSVTAKPARIAAVLAHPFWGLLILIGILGLTLYLTYTVALPASTWLYNTAVRSIAQAVSHFTRYMPEWVQVVIVQGIIGGVGTVLSFIPVLLVFFTVLGLLEESRYLAHATRVTDRYLQWIGLPGTACIPLSMGFGCNTSAILGCRILKDRRSRLLTMLLVPFVPCTSRLATIALLTPTFFGKDAVWVTWGLVSMNLFILAAIGFTVNQLKPRHGPIAAALALPPLRIPQPKPVLQYILRNILEFITKIRILVLFSTLIWALSYFPNGEISSSYLSQFGKAITPLGRLIGLEDWRFIVAMLSSFASKENVIAVLGVLFPLFGSEHSLSTQVVTALSPAARLSFLVMQMLFIPCASTLVAIRQESSSWKLVLLQTGLMLLSSILIGILVYQLMKG